MSAPATRDAALAALRDVHDPELHRSIVDLGMVGDVEVHEGRVLVAIRLTVAGCPLKAEIQRRVTEALAPMPGVDTIRVTMDAMTDEEVRYIAGKIESMPVGADSGGILLLIIIIALIWWAWKR